MYLCKMVFFSHSICSFVEPGFNHFRFNLHECSKIQPEHLLWPSQHLLPPPLGLASHHLSPKQRAKKWEETRVQIDFAVFLQYIARFFVLFFWAKKEPKRAREGFQRVRGGIPLHLDKVSAQMGPFGANSGPFLFFNFPKTHSASRAKWVPKKIQ